MDNQFHMDNPFRCAICKRELHADNPGIVTVEINLYGRALNWPYLVQWKKDSPGGMKLCPGCANDIRAFINEEKEGW